jgi:hypothetical protein
MNKIMKIARRFEKLSMERVSVQDTAEALDTLTYVNSSINAKKFGITQKV